MFIAELLAFSVAFQLLYEFPAANADETVAMELDYVPRALFTLLKWTLGEVCFFDSGTRGPKIYMKRTS